MHNSTYSEDGQNIVSPGAFSSETPDKFPVELLDAILDSKVSTYRLKDALSFRRITRNATSEWVKVADLVDVDLRGKSVYIYFGNWEDSEWMFSDGVASVVEEGSDEYGQPNYVFKSIDRSEGHNYYPLDSISWGPNEKTLIVTPNEEVSS